MGRRPVLLGDTSLIIFAFAIGLVSTEFSLHEFMSPLAAVVILSALSAKSFEGNLSCLK